MRRLEYVLIAALAFGLVAGGSALDRWWQRPAVVVTHPDATTTVATVNAPTLKPSVVTPYVIDKPQVTKLMAELAASKAQITSLTETIATLTSQGSGTIVYVDRPVPGSTQVVHEMTFTDGRLTFHGLDDKAIYSLHQQFEALAAVGRDASGHPTAAVRLFEVGPGEMRTQLTDAKTVLVAASPTSARWFLSPSLQAGVGYTTTPGAVVGVQWLKHGSSRAAEDGMWAVATPVVFLNATTRDVGLLPVSVNVGYLKFSPFRDLWVSPLVTRSRVGVTLTATF